MTIRTTVTILHAWDTAVRAWKEMGDVTLEQFRSDTFQDQLRPATDEECYSFMVLDQERMKYPYLVAKGE